MGLRNLQRKKKRSKGMWLTQSKKATDTLRWLSNSSILHLFFSIFFFFKSCFSTEKAKAGRLPGVPGQLELHNEALSQNKQAHTLFQRKREDQKKKTDRQRGGGGGEEAPQKKNLSLRETNSI